MNSNGIRCVASLPIAPDIIAQLIDAGFRMVEDLQDLGPVQLSKGAPVFHLIF